MEYTLFCDFFDNFFFVSCTGRTAQPISMVHASDPQSTPTDTMRCLLGVSSEKFCLGDYPVSKFFGEHFACKSKKSNNFWTTRDRQKISMVNHCKLGSRNQMDEMVTSFPVWHVPWHPKSSFRLFSKRKSAYNVETVWYRRKVSIKHEQETTVALPTGDVISGIKRLLADKINTAIIDNRKTDITFEWCMPDKKCVLNIKRKPWSNYQTATFFLVQGAP
jgi:hypothetical protein